LRKRREKKNGEKRGFVLYNITAKEEEGGKALNSSVIRPRKEKGWRGRENGR